MRILLTMIFLFRILLNPVYSQDTQDIRIDLSELLFIKPEIRLDIRDEVETYNTVEDSHQFILSIFFEF